VCSSGSVLGYAVVSSDASDLVVLFLIVGVIVFVCWVGCFGGGRLFLG